MRRCQGHSWRGTWVWDRAQGSGIGELHYSAGQEDSPHAQQDLAGLVMLQLAAPSLAFEVGLAILLERFDPFTGVG